MSATVRFEGLDELRAALKALPEHLRGGAATIVIDHAEAAKQEIVDAYPEVTGNLKGRVVVEPQSSTYGAAAKVKSTAKHAWMFENGTQTRQNALGHNRGAMPPGRVFVPIMVRRRREMHGDLVDLLQHAPVALEVRDGG